MPKVWVVRADGGALTDAFVNGGYASVGWDVGIDMSHAQSRIDIESLYWQEDSHSGNNKYKAGQEIGQLHIFFNEIEAGDYLVTPSTKSGILRYGEVEGGSAYFAEGADDVDSQPNRRKVKWATSRILRSELSVPFQHSLQSQRTIYSLEKHAAEFFEKIGRTDLAPLALAVGGSDSDPYATAIDRLLQLHSDEFEELVGALLEAMGFEKVRVTGKSGDGGVDVIGILHASTLADIRLFVQVKRYQRGRRVNKAEVERLRAGIPFGGKGAFVTTSDFARGAIEAANETDFPEIGLTNGDQLIDLLLDHWSKIPEDFQEQIGLRPGLVLV